MHFSIFISILATFWCLSLPTKCWGAGVRTTVNSSHFQSVSTSTKSQHGPESQEYIHPLYSRLLFHKDSRIYYESRPFEPERGPCGKFMKFYEESAKSPNGVCLCEKPTKSCPSRPLLYWNETKRCYPVYDKGPCGIGQWLINNEKGEPTCQRNPCPSNGTEIEESHETDVSRSSPFTTFYFRHENDCYLSNTRAFCKGSQKVFLLATEPGPVCLAQEPYCGAASIGNSKPSSCPPNTTLQRDGTCAATASFS